MSRITGVLGGVRWPGGSAAAGEPSSAPGGSASTSSRSDRSIDPNIARARLRVLSRWVELSTEMVRAAAVEVESAEGGAVRNPDPQSAGDARVRSTLVRFLREEMNAAEVKFVPAALARGRDPEAIRMDENTVLLHLVGSREVAEVKLREGCRWGEPERLLAERAAATAGSVLATMAAVHEARRQSLTDGLTGLYNRRSLDRLLEREVLLCGRHHTTLTVAVMDIDHFKATNDRYGHPAGDAMLRHVGRTLTQTLRRSDLAFRYGGDEFVVLLPQTGLGAAIATMEKLRRNVAATLPHGAAEGLPPPKLSIGVAEYWRNATPQDLLRAADETLYRAKRENRDCVRAYRAAA